MPPRLDSGARRKAIIEAAMPLFAGKGFAATTTKEIAQAAGVSEALIFKHFPSKASLYQAIFLACIEDDPEYARLLSLPPSTATLVEMVRALVTYMVVEVPNNPEELARIRLGLLSLLEDGEFLRLVYEGVRDRFLPSFAAAAAAARASGDLVEGPVTVESALWLADHLCYMLACLCLPGRSVVPYGCDRQTLACQTLWFVLRGIGLRDSVIADHTGAAAEPCGCGGIGAFPSGHSSHFSSIHDI
ncbi:TetR/AcrR family transcriptional regulator [Azospirillum thermophilum]|uniref:TetR/AcrR family transcriptional regulator n=1 Tax=Azospirillum thermophilum TaxID=2202148 RepID=A0A2S2CLM5_9PROT|nr:TetR/AcrR family transcriptional regulator [Azospirillum thermophilum]AWK85381.1 TetR/AcrR family transcriptional regulator [Azospirillum thermophilum]